MTTFQELFALAFVVGVVSVYVLATSFLLRGFARRRAGRRQELTPVGTWGHRVIFALALAGLPCIAYAYFVEPYWLEVTHVRVTSAKLSLGTGPIRIVFLSDLHSDPAPRLEEKLPAVVAAERPDLILFGGDCINSPAGLPVFRRCMSELAGIAPTFAVRGNVDVWHGDELDLFDGTGVRELKAETVTLELRGAHVWLAGVPVGSEASIDRVLTQVPAQACSIFLYHYPDETGRAAAHAVDLYLAGHTHGGQVALPFYGALLTLSKSGKKYEAGLYRVRDTWVYVTRGIGMEGGAPRVRFLARPEVTVLDVTPP